MSITYHGYRILTDKITKYEGKLINKMHKEKNNTELRAYIIPDENYEIIKNSFVSGREGVVTNYPKQIEMVPYNVILIPKSRHFHVLRQFDRIVNACRIKM